MEESRNVEWIAEGFTHWPMKGRFVKVLADVYYKAVGEHLIFRVGVGPHHCNGFEIAHGGFISTMADIWLSYNVAHLLPKEARFVTASLTVDFLQPVRSGAWMESKLDRFRLGRRLHHASGAILVGGSAVAAMRATFAAF